VKNSVTLALHLQLQRGVLGAVGPAGGARLDEDVAEELVERLAVLPRSSPVQLRVHVTAPESHDAVSAVIRHHFAKLRERSEYRLMRTLRMGRFSLILGTVVLLVALGLAETARRMLTGGVGIVIEAGLTIVGWVALWRPLDLLLFERWQLRRDVALYRRLEQMEIVVDSEGPPG
jgi:hypothetical protein